MDLDFDVVELDSADPPERGEVAPDFTRPLVTPEYWEDHALSALSPPVVLVFHPMVGSFSATYIWQELRERSLDGTVVGLTISTPYDLTRFVEANDLDGTGVGLFSDPANEVAATYGIAHDLDGMAGISEPRPAVFVLGAGRTVEYRWAASEWPEFPPYDAVEEALADYHASEE